MAARLVARVFDDFDTISAFNQRPVKKFPIHRSCTRLTVNPSNIRRQEMANEIIKIIVVDVFVTAKGVRVFHANHLNAGLRKSECLGVNIVYVERVRSQNRNRHRTVRTKIDSGWHGTRMTQIHARQTLAK